MQEKTEKVIGGAQIETASSDASIIRKINSLKREASGMNGVKLEAKFEVLPPKPVYSENTNVSTTRVTEVSTQGLTHKDSALGQSIVIQRNLKKAA